MPSAIPPWETLLRLALLPICVSRDFVAVGQFTFDNPADLR
ncbi:MAG: hypothetical protein [Olavius algarvensis Delta 4 endosymbiont]|nr:MAG: hypothetical protein [Olavius algarvensis Delta 4 endosymbiont]